MKEAAIPIYIINLKNRIDRKQHILKEFENKNEFDVILMEACENKIGALGLWNTLQHIFNNVINKVDEYIILCEDDHQFTQYYSKDVLFKAIADGKKNDADILLGGISWFSSASQVEEKLFWVEKFTGLQFTIVFRNFFKIMSSAVFDEFDNADYKISSLSNRVFFIYPFISVQKEFGYSDVTTKNNLEGRVEELFMKSSANAQMLKDVRIFYEKRAFKNENEPLENITIPTYIINLPEMIEPKSSIEKEFAGRQEFDIMIVERCKNDISAVGQWQSIRKIIKMAVFNGDDVIIICQDDHVFTKQYSRQLLLRNIIEAHHQGVEILSGGIKGFGLAVPINKNRFWINKFLGVQFLVLFSSVFKKILDEPFDNTITMDGVFSDITSNKMVLFPFISAQKEFGYPNVTKLNAASGAISTLFSETAKRLQLIRKFS